MAKKELTNWTLTLSLLNCSLAAPHPLPGFIDVLVQRTFHASNSAMVLFLACVASIMRARMSIIHVQYTCVHWIGSLPQTQQVLGAGKDSPAQQLRP